MGNNEKGSRARGDMPARVSPNRKAVETFRLKDDLEDLQVKVFLVEERVGELERSLMDKHSANARASPVSAAGRPRGVK